MKNVGFSPEVGVFASKNFHTKFGMNPPTCLRASSVNCSDGARQHYDSTWSSAVDTLFLNCLLAIDFGMSGLSMIRSN